MENIKMKYNELLNKINAYTNFNLDNVLKWNLEIMTPLETYRKLSYIIERYKK